MVDIHRHLLGDDGLLESKAINRFVTRVVLTQTYLMSFPRR